MKIVLLGAPGSGKGTQAKLICEKMAIPHISVGDILRANIEHKTSLGELAYGYISEGHMVPDDVVIAIIKDRLKESDAQNGFILDGFPRSIIQAEELAKITKLDVVLFLDINEHVIEQRITSRRICSQCKGIFNVQKYFVDTCDKCGGRLIQRDDDKLDVVRKRIDEYNLVTTPLVKFYEKKKILQRVFGDGTPLDIFSSIEDVLKKVETRK